MNYLYTILSLLGVGFLGWVYSLVGSKSALKQKIAELEAGARIQEWSNKIDAQKSKVTESERDYAEQKKAFEESHKND